MAAPNTDFTKALVIIDVQNDFMHPDGAFPIFPEIHQKFVAALCDLVPRFRQSGHIIWVKADYLDRTEEPASMACQVKGSGVIGSNEWLPAATHVFEVSCCKASTFGEEIPDYILDIADPEDHVVTKRGYSAFYESNELGRLFAELGVTDAYFCGLASGTCVLATILDALKLEKVQVFGVTDCFGYRRLNTHEAAIEEMKKLPMTLVEGKYLCR